MIADFFNYYLYEPWRIFWLQQQISFTDKSMQIAEKQKEIAVQLIEHDKAKKEYLKLELLHMERGRRGK